MIATSGTAPFEGQQKQGVEFYVIERFRFAKTRRATWDSHWQDLKELVRPDANDFNRQTVPGYRRYDAIYDGTAIDANEELASGLHSYLTSPIERWFELGVVEGDKGWIDDPDSLDWLETVSDIIYAYYADPRSNMNPVLHEGYLDIGAFGSLVLSQEWDYSGGGHLLFKSYPLADCYYLENNQGVVDTMFRYYQWTGKQVVDEFGTVPLKLDKLIRQKGGMDRSFKIIHGVYPRHDRNTRGVLSTDKKWASVYVCEDTMELLEESGFDSFSFHVSRWIKIAGEVYGRGPAMKCLPDIKSLQVMEKTLLKAGQKAVDPPLVVPDDGFLLPIKTAPGSLIFKEPGAEKLEVLKFEGNLEFGLKHGEQKREYIRKCFYMEWLKMQKENKEMTATEVVDRRDEKLRLLAPMLGRQQSELLGPMIARTYHLLSKNGRIPQAPAMLQRRKLGLTYISPAARAQMGVRAQQMSQYMQDLLPMAQIKPEVMDAIDTDEMARQYALVRGVPRSILRNKAQLTAMREQQAKMQQIQQMAGVAEPASKSVLNLAKAQQGQ